MVYYNRNSMENRELNDRLAGIEADIKALGENVAEITGMMTILVGLPEKVEKQGRQIGFMQGGEVAAIFALAVAGIFYKLLF